MNLGAWELEHSGDECAFDVSVRTSEIWDTEKRKLDFSLGKSTGVKASILESRSNMTGIRPKDRMTFKQKLLALQLG